MNNEEQVASTTVEVSLTQQQAEAVQDLLANYTYAYRSDQDVDCKRELVSKDKAGTYPYVAEAPAPDIQNPVYDWSLAKWVDQDAKSNAAQVAKLSQKVDDLAKKQETSDTNGDTMASDIKAMKQNSQAQTRILMQLITMVQPTTQPAPVAPSTDTEESEDKEEGTENAE